MGRVHAPFLAFNQGEVSKLALTRVDNEALRLAAEQQVNWLPYVMGAMTFRPGLQKLDSTRSDAACVLIPFIFANDDTALIELTASNFRIWDGDAVLTAPSVSTTVTSGTFSATTGWTTSANSGGDATINTGAGQLELHARALGSAAFCEQTISVILADRSVQHRLRIVVTRGPVTFQVGSSSGTQDLIGKTSLGAGTHSIAFTPTTATFWIQFSTKTKTTKIVDSCTVESSGAVVIPTPWGASDLALVRHAQSGDIVYAACDGYQPRQIERRENNSWSIVLFDFKGGPFTSPPVYTSNFVMDPSLSVGGTQSIDVSESYFTSSFDQSLIRLRQQGQTRTENVGGDTQFTRAIRVTGATAGDRAFDYSITGTWAGTIVLQRSVDGPDTGFLDNRTDTINATATINDSVDYAKTVVWYRAGFKTGGYTSGNAAISFDYDGALAEDAGYVKLVSLVDPTTYTVEVYGLTSGEGTTDWDVSEWSDVEGWPSAVKFHDGRLWFAGRDRLWSSVSDDFDNFNDQVEGDSGPISRSIATGPIDVINDLLPLTRLIVLCEGAEVSVRSSAFDEPLTPTNFTLKECSNQGSANLPALKIDTRGVFVEKSGRKIYELAFNLEIQDYRARDLTFLNNDIGKQGFVSLAMQRQPDTVLHFIRGDGQAACLVQDPANGVECWFRIMTLGVIENVVVLPGDQEDAVYYVVKRTINGSTKRFLEKFSLRSQVQGGTLSRNLDCHTVVSQASSTTVSGLTYLEGETVYVWANGKDLGSYTVASGAITVSEAVTSAIVGLGGVSFAYDSATAAASVTCATKYNGYPAEVYADGKYVGPVTIASGIATLPNGRTAKKITAYLGFYGLFRSAKLAYGAQMGTALVQPKKIEGVGVVAFDTHYQGLQYGSSIDNLQPLPLVEGGQDTAAHTVWAEHDEPIVGLSGSWDTDSRLHLVATAPKPVTLAAAVIAVSTNESR